MKFKLSIDILQEGESCFTGWINEIRGVVAQGTSVDEVTKELMKVLAVKFELEKNSKKNRNADAGSPITLTQVGIDFANEIKANQMIDKNWTKIFENLEKNIDGKNAYDIQSYCLETTAVQPELFFDKDSLDTIKAYAFKVGNPFKYYSDVFGVLIRDKYLKIKSIDQIEIDKNDPTKK